MPRALLRTAALAILLVLAFAALAQVAVPPLTARVTDLTGTLSPQQRAALEERLAAFEARKGSQIAVLIVPTTQPEAIEQYGIRVAEQWKVGRKNVDDGAILIVAMQDRALRIEVGYGLEGALPDAIAKRIVEEHIVPRFKQGDFFGGVDAGVSRMMSVIEGEPLPPPRGRAGAVDTSVEQFLMLAAVMVLAAGWIVRAIFGRVFGSTVLSGVTGFAAWLTLGSIVTAIVVGFLAFILSLMTSSGAMPVGRRGGWYTGGWGGGMSGGGWSGGGGGGWSGGGGGFGGGGASGRW